MTPLFVFPFFFFTDFYWAVLDWLLFFGSFLLGSPPWIVPIRPFDLIEFLFPPLIICSPPRARFSLSPLFSRQKLIRHSFCLKGMWLDPPPLCCALFLLYYVRFFSIWCFLCSQLLFPLNCPMSFYLDKVYLNIRGLIPIPFCKSVHPFFLFHPGLTSQLFLPLSRSLSKPKRRIASGDQWRLTSRRFALPSFEDPLSTIFFSFFPGPQCFYLF